MLVLFFVMVKLLWYRYTSDNIFNCANFRAKFVVVSSLLIVAFVVYVDFVFRPCFEMMYLVCFLVANILPRKR